MDSADGGAYPDLEDTVVSQVTRMIGEGKLLAERKRTAKIRGTPERRCTAKPERLNRHSEREAGRKKGSGRRDLVEYVFTLYPLRQVSQQCRGALSRSEPDRGFGPAWREPGFG